MRRLFYLCGCFALMGSFIFGGCEPKKKAESCLKTADCGDGKVCKGQLCVDCSRDSECPNGLHCLQGACGLGCAKDEHCGPEERCLSMTCVPKKGGCAVDTDCAEKELCIHQRCQPRCTSASDCTSGLYCDKRSGLCVKCVEDGHCGVGEVCEQGTCSCPKRNTCGGGCVDTQNDFLHCGGCGAACQHALCKKGTCLLVAQNLSLGGTHSCIVAKTGEARCWGGNEAGGLGDGTRRSRSAPVRVQGLDKSPLELISAQGVGLTKGFDSTCVLLKTGEVMCWGANQFGQLGDGSVTSSTRPVKVEGLVDVQAIVSGKGVKNDGIMAGFHRCVILKDATVKCWGSNSFGELGDTTNQQRNTPVAVQNIQGVLQLAAGGGHTCALLKNKRVFCWGYNHYGQLGTGNTRDVAAPIDAKIRNVKSIAAGVHHTCAVLDTGEVMCWGRNDHGQLGDGTTEDRSSPVMVKGLKDVAFVSAGLSHSCALHNNGEVSCWGRNQFGALGTGDTVDTVSGPKVVQQLREVSHLAVGQVHTCVILRSNGAVECWGHNDFGQLGDRSVNTSGTPVQVVEE